MSAGSVEGPFGCDHCWPESAEAAWRARSQLEHESELIDESHFHVLILSCTKCSQRYLSIFTELIDWEAGEDPQCWTVLPLTTEERKTLLRFGTSITETTLNSLAESRRSLRRDHPKNKEPECSWVIGIPLPPHD